MAHIIRKVKGSKPREISCGILRGLTSSRDFNKMDFAHVTISEPTKRHFHKKLTEVYFVLSGSIVVEADGKKERLKKGEMIMIFPNTKHKAWKAGKKKPEILVVCSPPWSEKDEILLE